MIQRAMIDTNVVLDFLLKRQGFTKNAEKIFAKIETRSLIGCISSSAITDVYYIVESSTDSGHAREMIELLPLFHEVWVLDREQTRVMLKTKGFLCKIGRNYLSVRKATLHKVHHFAARQLKYFPLLPSAGQTLPQHTEFLGREARATAGKVFRPNH
jgi:predicted nucleic acid-binding protein